VNAELYKHYQRLRADYIKTLTGYKEVHVWDLSVRPPALQRPRFTIDQASQIIRDALAPLGAEFRQELAALLDPANGRMDIVPGEHRKRGGGFSKGYIGTDSVFYSPGFSGSYRDVDVLAHEATHAVHRQLMNRNHVLPRYAGGLNIYSRHLPFSANCSLPTICTVTRSIRSGNSFTWCSFL